VAYESIPQKKPGDPLRAAEVNTIGSVVNQFSHSRPGTFMSGMRCPSITGDVGIPPFLQCIVKVIGESITIDLDSGCHACIMRYFDHADGTWKDDDTQRMIDPTDVDLTLSVGDKVLAYWNEQRQAFVPLAGVGAVKFRRFILRTDLEPNTWAVAEQLEYTNPDESSASSSRSTSSGSSASSSAGEEVCDLTYLCPNGTFFPVFDPLGEFLGNADYAHGIAYRLVDTPTYCQLKAQWLGPATLPNELTDENPWEVLRLTCLSFLTGPCAKDTIGEWCP